MNESLHAENKLCIKVVYKSPHTLKAVYYQTTIRCITSWDHPMQQLGH